MSDLSSLISDLGRASEPSRELDEAIVHALCPDAIIDFYIVGDDEKTVFGATALGLNKVEVPRYTESLDAALTLLSANVYWHVAAGKTRDDEPMFGAMVQEAKFDGDELGIAETAISPALALTVAALKAHESIRAREMST